MPQASSELRERMEERFGDPVADTGPMRFLEEAGYRLTGDWQWIPKPGVNSLEAMTRDEFECLMFLMHEWDFGALVTIKPADPEGRPVDQAKLDEFLASTRSHVSDVQACMNHVIHGLEGRAKRHDTSKFTQAEAPIFASLSGLPKVDVGTAEYERRRGLISKALESHYAKNDHHPEHWPGGINTMTLPALLEMLCDWRAAWQARAATITFEESVTELLENRFKADPVLADILRATCRAWGWFKTGEPAERIGDGPDPRARKT